MEMNVRNIVKTQKIIRVQNMGISSVYTPL